MSFSNCADRYRFLSKMKLRIRVLNVLDIIIIDAAIRAVCKGPCAFQVNFVSTNVHYLWL